MRSGFLIGLATGVASAFLSYSATRGASALLVVLLGLLTPLPALIAGLGWGWLSAAVSAITGALVTGLFAGAGAAAGYFLTLGAPAILIAYLAYLSRPAADDSEAREWYPPGRLMAAMTLYAGALPVLFLPFTGGSYDGWREPIGKELRGLSQRMPELGMKSLTDEQMRDLTDQFIGSLPALLAAYWLIVFTINAYLAGRIALASGHLARDWPDLPAMAYPMGFPLLLALAAVAAYAPGVIGIAGTGFIGALVFAFFLSGLALAHFVARSRAPWAVWLVYAALILFRPHAAIVITLAGLLDPIFKLKQRLGAGPPPS
jgi:hypothetical protein